MKLKNAFGAIALFAAFITLSAEGRAENSVDQVVAQRSATNTESVHRDQARKAMKDAVAQALDSVEANNKLDLDIRLLGPTSKKIAADR